MAARWAPAPSPGRRRPPQFYAGAAILGLMTVVALLAPWLAPHGYADQDLLRSLQPPAWLPGGDWAYPLGTDRLGRDLCSRLMVGARVSIAVALLSVLLGGGLGTMLGLAAGYFGGRVDRTISRLIDVQLSFPPVFVAIAIMAALGQSLPKLIVVLALVTWVQYARVARANTLSVREREFVAAARALGAAERRILSRHVLPSILPPLLVVGAVNMSNVILAEAALSFLGLGVQPPVPAWGSMVSDGRTVQSLAWWNTVFPGMAIAVLVIGANLLGDGLQRAR
ncbi:MAG: ABC transporter permease [Armatimonadota bacterium]|nr:ABC transporter permease [Armatimonadota bacterium]MDR7550349.1 ABC transporter permease [Armatimonadota bacterium]